MWLHVRMQCCAMCVCVLGGWGGGRGLMGMYEGMPVGLCAVCDILEWFADDSLWGIGSLGIHILLVVESFGYHETRLKFLIRRS